MDGWNSSPGNSFHITGHSSRDPWMRSAKACVLFLLIVLLKATAGISAYGQQKLYQMLHTSWTAHDGAPQAIRAIIQAPDGKLWIGSSAGLYIFDGVHFARFEPAAGEPALPSNRIVSVYLSTDGSIWVGTELEGAARIQNGHVTVYQKRADGSLLGTVTALQQGLDGSMWAIVNRASLVRFGNGGAWTLMPSPSGHQNGFVRGQLFASSGTQWVAEGGKLYRRYNGEASFTSTSIAADFITGMHEAPDKSLWVADVDSVIDRGRLQHLDRNGNLLLSVPLPMEVIDLLPAEDGQVWLTYQDGGLVKVTPPSGRHHTSEKIDWTDTFHKNDGLASSATVSLFRDAEGDIWAGGEQGLDRFRPARLIRLPLSDQAEAVCASPAGRMLIYGRTNRLYSVDAGAITEIAGARDVHVLSCGANNQAWYADHSGIWSVQAEHLRPLPAFPGWIPYNVLNITELRDGTLVIGAHSGLWTFRRGKYAELSTGGLPSHRAPLLILDDSKGRLWLNYGYPLWVMKNGIAHKVTTSPPELGIGTALIDSSHGIFLAGSQGLALADENGLRLLRFAEPELAKVVTGGAEAKNHDLWVNGLMGIARIPAAEIEAALNDNRHVIAAERVAEGDYIGPALATPGVSPSVTKDSTGKLWFATLNGVVWLDPDQSPPVLSRPVLTIESIAADGHALGAKRTIPPGPQTVEIDYLGVNLAAPEGVTYKYKLQGLEDTWQEAGHRAQAFYTHLKPGKYRFEVLAANASNIWSEPVVSDYFTVLPHFYQTWWFFSLAFVAVAAGVVVLFQNRLQRSRQLVEVQLRERFQERARIARELHDTLLQGFHGLAMRLGVTVQMISPTDPAHAALEDAMKRVDEALAEGRKGVNDLRAELNVKGGLADEFEQMVISLRLPEFVGCKVVTTGQPIPVRPRVRYELTAIGREALTNALRHSMCSNIQVEVDFCKQSLRLAVKDDGTGISSEIQVAGGRAGHWGLDGMRERAASVGGTLELISKESFGTTIQVAVPSHAAYLRLQGSWLSGLWHKSAANAPASQD